MKKKILSVLWIICLFISSACSNQNTVSPSFDSSQQEYIKKQCVLLLEPFMRSIALPDSENPHTLGELEDWEIKNFILLNAFYTDTPEYLYKGFVTNNGESLNPYHYKKEKIDQIAFEVFGKEEIALPENIEFDELTNEYYTGLEFEIGRLIKLANVEEPICSSEGLVQSTFQLSHWGVEKNGDPDWSDYSLYKVAFQAMETDNRIFLRFVQVERVE